jgi:hypothetical protein
VITNWQAQPRGEVKPDETTVPPHAPVREAISSGPALDGTGEDRTSTPPAHRDRSETPPWLWVLIGTILGVIGVLSLILVKMR